MIHIVIHDMGPYSDREIIIEGVFKEKEDAIRYVNDKGFTKEKYNGWIRPLARQRGYSESDIYYVENWEVK
ncbi:hypothetical protein [Enterococcus durans]|uniref:hypothetical protein n=1 Tax=Enterococcus durans TaxID=53345 RepID=UPI00291D6703|nr:hypothetical protein AUSP0058_00024 [uncultured phage]